MGFRSFFGRGEAAPAEGRGVEGCCPCPADGVPGIVWVAVPADGAWDGIPLLIDVDFLAVGLSGKRLW